jgi:hypothetical protein
MGFVLLLLQSSCGICLNSVKRGQGTAIYTAECAHAFHFPCIASYVRKHGSLVCPVCNSTWKDVPLLAIHKNLHQNDNNLEEDPSTNTITKVEEKKVVIVESSPRAIKTPTTPTPPHNNHNQEHQNIPIQDPMMTMNHYYLQLPVPDSTQFLKLTKVWMTMMTVLKNFKDSSPPILLQSSNRMKFQSMTEIFRGMFRSDYCQK